MLVLSLQITWLLCWSWYHQMYPSITPLSSALQALDEQLYGETLDHLQVPRDGQPQGADQSQSPADQSITTL